MIGVYFESWACPWTNLAASSALAKIDKPIDVIFLSFVKPNTTYKKGQLTFAGTGLDFSLDFNVVKMAISILKSKGIKVLLAVGGATYPFDNYQAQACADLMNDLGCDGLDIDWEPAQGYAARALLGPIIDGSRKAIGPSKLLSLAGFSTGCYDPNGDTFRGMNIDGLKSHGYMLDFVNIMAYDAGSTFSVIQCYESFKKYFPRTINLGFQVGKQGWGDALLTIPDVEKACRYIAVKGDGCFVWAYFKTGPPSASEVCQVASTLLNALPLYPPTPLNQFSCPNCKTKLTVT
jgi:chitinase